MEYEGHTQIDERLLSELIQNAAAL